MNLSVQVENNEDYDKLLDSLYDLHEIQNNISSLLVSQDEKIESIEEKMFHIDQEVKKGLIELQEAKKFNFSYQKIFLGGIVGGLLGGPLGFLTGIKYMGLTTGTGALLGGISGYSIQ
jgi:hypothetical protein